jgi:hypothetical protein
MVNGTCGRRKLARENLRERGLPRTIATHEPHSVPGVDGEGHVRHEQARTHTYFETNGLQHKRTFGGGCG